jgi:hypothetical protein
MSFEKINPHMDTRVEFYFAQIADILYAANRGKNPAKKLTDFLFIKPKKRQSEEEIEAYFMSIFHMHHGSLPDVYTNGNNSQA